MPAARPLRPFGPSIRQRIGILILAMLGFVCVFGALLIAATTGMARKSSGDIDAFSRINGIKSIAGENHRLLASFLESGDLESLALFNDHTEIFARALRDIRTGRMDMDYRLLCDALYNSFDSYNAECNEAIRARVRGDPRNGTASYRAAAIVPYIQAYASQLLEHSLTTASQEYSLGVERTDRLRNLAFLALGIFATLSMGVGLALAGRLSRPLVALVRAAGELAGGNLDVEVPAHPADDEVGRLSRSFSLMSASIRTMVEDLRAKAYLEQRLREDDARIAEAEKSLRDARFLALQSQINPHFLFNTLNTVSRLLMLRSPGEALEVLDALCALLRYSLGPGAGTATLGSELEIVRRYILIQKYRFGDRIIFSLESAIPDPEAVRIPRFTLQPLVENAIIHGLEPRIEGGVLVVSVHPEGDSIRIEVDDNGVGMDEERRAAVLSMGETEIQGHTSSIGLSNVFGRLRSHFGERVALEIRSGQPAGTRISILIPARSGFMETP